MDKGTNVTNVDHETIIAVAPGYQLFNSGMYSWSSRQRDFYPAYYSTMGFAVGSARTLGFPSPATAEHTCTSTHTAHSGAGLVNESITLMPGTGKTYAVGNAVAVVAVGSEQLTLNDEATVEISGACSNCGKRFVVRGEEKYCDACSKSVASRADGEWFNFVSFFIPKMISEPWLGDLREDRINMTKQGYSCARISLATAMQITLLILYWVIENALNILTPFKK